MPRMYPDRPPLRRADAKQGLNTPIENPDERTTPAPGLRPGWRMKESDEMDMLGFQRLRAWDATREQEKKKSRHAFIDEV